MGSKNSSSMSMDEEAATPEVTTESAASIPPEEKNIDAAPKQEVDTTNADNNQDAAAADPAAADPAAPPADADDMSYSTTEEEDDDDDDNNNGGNSDDAAAPPGNGAAEDALLKATVLKEEGNGFFQKGEWDEAARRYRRGTNRLKKFSNVGADAQITALQLTLQTNLSMVLFKQEKFRQSKDVASKALSLDPKHVKALYRRAVASRKLGDFDQAKTDLRTALQVDSTNVTCKKELAAVKKQLEQDTKAQKSALAKAFSSSAGGSLLYNDKEEEERQKKLEKEKQKKQKEEEKKKRKQEWEDECVRRMTKGVDAISFDDWQKEQEEARKKKRKEEQAEEEKRKRQEAEARRKQQQASSASSKDDDDDDDDQLTEQELASLRGYKKTKDGRTTSYFTREISEEERQRLGDIAPKKLDSSSSTTSATSGSPTTPLVSATTTTSSSPTAASSMAASTSAWNQAGTWEEKDCTSWCKDRLTQQLSQVTCSSSSQGDPVLLTVKITKVEELTGEGSVAITGGKKRYIFDFHAKLQYEISAVAGDDVAEDDNDGDDSVLATGVVRLPDISSAHIGEDDLLEVTFDSSWKKAPPSSSRQEEACRNVRTELEKALRVGVHAWVQDFNQQF